MSQSIELVDQIILMAQAQAKELDEYNILRHKALRTLGENAVVFHLKSLRELLEKEQTAQLAIEKSTRFGQAQTITIGNRELQVAIGAFNPVLSMFDKLPHPLHTGLFVKVTDPTHSWVGWGGEVVDHYINGNDCGGDYGKEMYCIEKVHGERFDVRAKDCTIL